MPTFYGAIDLSKNELRNAVVQNLASAPGGQQGQLYFDSTAKILYWHNGTTWVSASGATPASAVTASGVGDASVVGTSLNYARQDHVHAREPFGAVTASSLFGTGPFNGSGTAVAHNDHVHGTPNHDNAAHSSIPVNVGAAATGALPMGGFQINNLADPTAATDAVTKQYADNLANGLSWKAPVRAYGAANLTLSGIPSSGLTDGVTLASGDRVLANNQSTPAQNGIYVVAAGAWSRATDNDAANEMVNATVYISEGTTYADTQWTCVTNAPITIGTTTIQFQQIAGAGTYNWGNGLTNVGNTVNVNPGTGITIVADAVTVDTTVIPPNTRLITAGAGLTGGGNLSADRTIDFVAGDTSLTVAADSVVVNTGVIATVASLAGYVPTSRTLTFQAPLTGGTMDLSANRTIGIGQFSGVSAGIVPASTGGTLFLRGDGTWASPPGTGISKVAFALTGTASPEVITHNLNTRDVQVTVLNGASPYTAVEVDWDATTVNTVTIRYNPNLGAGYRCVVVG